MNCTACNPTDTDMVELGDLQLYHQPVSVSVYDVRFEHVVCAPVAGLRLLHPAPPPAPHPHHSLGNGNVLFSFSN